jgi:YVTN family beta-propeller protein
LWVTNELSASVSIINTATRTVKKSLVFEIAGMRKNDISPVGMLITPDGKTAWVALGRANHVAEVDVATHTVRKVILAGKRTWGVGLNGDGSRLYAVNGLSDDLTIVDVASGKAIKTVPAGRVPHSVITN